jgi:transcriptional regulator with PAS, ATPase and Fis domain
VFPITVPALRERQDDIPLLTAYLVEKLRLKMGKKINHILADLMSKLKQYNWPGNVRELENIIERSLIVSTGNSLILDGLPILGSLSVDASMTEANSSATTIRPLQDIEREYIRSVCAV